MTVTREEEKPWKTDLARKAAQRREQVGLELDELIKKATSFEDALRQAVELMKARFARYSSVTAYVADGEELAVHTALERPQGPERVASGAARWPRPLPGQQPTVFADLTATPAWAPGGSHERQRDGRAGPHGGGLWAILEVWSDFRGAFSPQDVKLLGRVAQALAKKTPAA
jgi:hypothetical protein